MAHKSCAPVLISPPSDLKFRTKLYIGNVYHHAKSDGERCISVAYRAYEEDVTLWKCKSHVTFYARVRRLYFRIRIRSRLRRGARLASNTRPGKADDMELLPASLVPQSGVASPLSLTAI